ncbi:MAG TPA: type IV pilus biogenesis/stability protein PilW [Xanthomonadales bacterium]|nr:type IV pilus biogenesis/stability protein PilW [Xanthomonadales bacterium]
MKNFKGLIVLLLAAVWLAGCYPSSTKKDDKVSDAQQAAETNTALGRQYMERGQYEIALEKLKRAVAFDKTYAPAHTLLGFLYENIGMMKEAGEQYRLAVQYDPTDGEINNNYAQFLCNEGKGKEAEKYFQTAFKDPFYITPQIAYSNAGLCALGMNDLDKAERYLRQSLEYDMEISQSLLAMAKLNYRNGAYLGARAFLQRYESIEPQTAESLLLGYQIERALGDTSASNNYQSMLLQRFPDSAEAAQATQQG